MLDMGRKFIFRLYKDEDDGKVVCIPTDEKSALATIAGTYEVIGLLNPKKTKPDLCDICSALLDVLDERKIGNGDAVRFIVKDGKYATIKLMGELIEQRYVRDYNLQVGYLDDIQYFR